MECIRRRAASNGCTIVDDEFFCFCRTFYSQVFFNRSVRFHGDVAFQVRRTVDCQVLANVCIALQVRIAFDSQFLINRCIAMDTEVLHDISIIHRSLTRFNRVARNGGLCDGPFFNGRIVVRVFKGCSTVRRRYRRFTYGIGNGFAGRVGNVLSSIGNGSASSTQADVFGTLTDTGTGVAIRYGTADHACCRIFYDVDEGGTVDQGIFRLGGGAVLGIAGFDQLFRFVHGAVGVVGLGPVSDGGGQAHGILVHNGGVGLAGNGVDGGLLIPIGELGFFFCCAPEIGSGLAIDLAHFFFSLIGQLGGSVGAVLVGNLADNGAGSIRFYINSLVGDLVLCFVGDVFCCQAAVAGHGRGLVSAYLGIQVGLVVFRDLAGDSGLQFSTNGVGHIAGCCVHQVFSRIGDGSISCAVGNITGCSIQDIFGIGCDRLICCIVCDAAFIHHTLNCRTVANLGGYRFTGRIGNGFCIIGHRFSSFVGNSLRFIADSAVGSNVADIAILCFVGNAVRSCVCQFFGIIGNSAICGRIGNIRRSLGGRSRVGSIGDFAGDVIYFLIHFGEYRIRRINLIEDFIDVLFECGSLAIGIIGNDITGFRCIHLFHISVDSIGSCFGLTFFRQSRSAGIGFSIRGIYFAIDRSHIPAMNFGIIVFIQFAGERLGIEFTLDFQIFHSRFTTYVQGTCINFSSSLDGASPCIQVSTGQGQVVPCHAFGYRKAVTAQYSAGCNILAGNVPGPCHDISAAGIQFAAGCQDIAAYGFDVAGSSVDFAARSSYFAPIGTDFPALGIHVAAAGLDESTVGLDIAIADGGRSIGQGSALYRSGRSHIPRSNIAISIHRKLPVGPFDAAVSIHSRLGCRIVIPASIDAFGIHHTAVGTNLDAIFAEGNLVFFAFIHNQGSRRFFGSADSPILVHRGGVLLQYIVVTQAQSAIDRFCQFGISCHTACQFIGISLAQGVEPIHHILVDLLDDLILGCICTQPSSRFVCQTFIQQRHVFANGIGGSHDSPILYGGIVLAHIVIRCLFFQIFLHIGDPGIQSRIGSFPGSSFSGICLFQIRHRVFPFQCFFINGISIGFDLRIQRIQVLAHRFKSINICPIRRLNIFTYRKEFILNFLTKFLNIFLQAFLPFIYPFFGINFYCRSRTSANRFHHYGGIRCIAKPSDREEYEGRDGGQGQASGLIACAGGLGMAFG